MVVIDRQDDLKAWLENGAREPAAFQGLRLTELDEALSTVSLQGCSFLGCEIGERVLARIPEDKAGLVTTLGALPKALPAFAAGIYTVADLYSGLAPDGTGWENTPDYAGWTYFNQAKNEPRALDLVQSIEARLHDTTQEQAVREFLQDRDVVAIMGGHDFKRQLEPAEVAAGKADVYWDCVEIAKTLTEAGFLIVTGGGPGLMEAGNLGALLAGSDAQTVAEVRALLTNEGFETPEWRATAMKARARIVGGWHVQPADAQFSLGIPTWLYGHEPPNMFASHHSKMFYNSLREDGLVTIANKGIIFFEGNAGTVQEVFQDATQNYYLGKGQTPTPMVLYNAGGYWDRPCDNLSWPTDIPMDKRKPLMPLLKQLAIEKKFQNALMVAQTPAAVVKFLKEANIKPSVRKADVQLGNMIAAK